MSFLPDDYKSPSTSNFYLKLQEGENRIRIMSSPVMGWEDWDANNKPIRFRMDNKPLLPRVEGKLIRHFWSFIVFNYTLEIVQIMHVTQNTIRKAIEALCKDKDWGSPFGYDIKICKTGAGKDTDYTVNPIPHKPMDEYLIKEFNAKPCNLEALFSNGDPFAAGWPSYTPMGTSQPTSEKIVVLGSGMTKQYITADQAQQLELIITECDPTKHKNIREFLAKSCEGSNDLSKMDRSVFDSMKQLLVDRRDQYQQTLKELSEVPF